MSAECRYLNDGTGPTCSCSGSACALGMTEPVGVKGERAHAHRVATSPGSVTPRTVLILCERAPVKVNPVPAMRYGLAAPGTEKFYCSFCGRRVRVVA